MALPASHMHPYYGCVSPAAAYDPVRTIFLFPPAESARTAADAEQFARASGWQALAEEEGALLVVPLAAHGWDRESPALPAELFAEIRGRVPTQSGRSLYGRDGMLWCWETLVDMVGYEDGAAFAGNALAACPGMFAAAALVGGVPDSYDRADEPSGHPMMPQVGPGYRLTNRQVPVCLWMLLEDARQGEEAVGYFSQGCGLSGPGRETVFGGVSARVWQDENAPARQIRLSEGMFVSSPELTGVIYRELFEKVIRWKCGPDGALAPLMGREALLESGRFRQERVQSGENGYDILVHVPKGREGERGLPLLFSLHGRGEPAWMFAQKNGWEQLADETGEFILAAPGSPENIWFLDRDGQAIKAMVELLAERYAADRSRIYLTGFSNGAMMTRQAGTSFPGLFAGLAPFNGPPSGVLPGAEAWPAALEALEAEGWQMPYFAYAGDRDPAAPAEKEELLERMLRLNGCGETPDAVYDGGNAYTPQRGYAEGGRQRTEVWLDGAGVPRAAMTVMEDMPHGAIPDESRSAWSFLRRYRRPEGSRKVVYVEGIE